MPAETITREGNMESKSTGGRISRRTFLAGSGLAALTVGAGAALTGCAAQNKTASSSTAAKTVTPENWYGEAADISTFSFTETIDTDILICGAGHGGLVAALAAAEAGAKTLVIEKSGSIGTLREYWGVINAQCQKDAGLNIAGTDVVNELMRYADYRADQRVINLWANESGETVDWLMGHLSKEGFTIVAETDIGEGKHGIYPIYPVQCNVQVPGAAAGPEAFSAVPQAVQKNAEGLGAVFRFDTALVQCIVENGKVTGAIAQTSDGFLRINASKGVLIATGGYEGDAELLKALQPETYNAIALASGLPQNVGDGIKAGIWAGGRKDEFPAFMLFDRGAVAPDAEAGMPASGEMFWMGSQPWLKVNLSGERFCNECAPYDFPIHATGLWKGNTWCSLYDANWKANVVAFHTQGCSRIDKSPTQGMTQTFLFEIIEGMNQALLEKGVIVQADTFAELAEKLGVPADALVKTVERYNAMAKTGVDADFGKPAKDLIALDNPPYFGVRQGAAAYCSLDGLRINADCAVIDKDDQPVEGLWAAGNVSGGFFSGNYPELIFGCACGRTMTEGRHAVLNMLGKK